MNYEIEINEKSIIFIILLVEWQHKMSLKSV